MNSLQERITQFRKMANDDPDNELGHFRLGQLLMEDSQFEAAVSSFRRTLELSPQFSKVFQLLGACLIKLSKRDDAIVVLTEGFAVADERGDNIPRDEMVKLLAQLGIAPPVSQKAAKAKNEGGSSGFQCIRPGCVAGSRARQLLKPPMSDELGKRIYDHVCAECWDYWLRNLSVKVINEMRLDLSTEQGCEMYDQINARNVGPDMNELPITMTAHDQYLVSFGKSGAVGVFTATQPLALKRGTRAVVQTSRGIEIGTVLHPATLRQARLLGAVASGAFVRPGNAEDLAQRAAQASIEQALYDASRAWTRAANR